MTGGRVVVLGATGRNFAAGMSGGIAYVYRLRTRRSPSRVNYEMVELEPLEPDDREWLCEIVRRHRELTGSTAGRPAAGRLGLLRPGFRKVMPRDYKRVLTVMREAEEDGLSEHEALGRVMVAAHG